MSESPDRPSRWQRWKPFLKDAAFFVALVGTSFAARSSFADHYYVPSGSMIPTVQVGDQILVNKTAYGVRVPFTGIVAVPRGTPRREDVVVLESPVDGTTLLKRVVAVPGDVVEVSGGRVFINGEALDESRHALAMERGGGPPWGPRKLEPDEYLVLGDHRGDSMDGRYFGPVKREAIFGRAERVFLRGTHPLWQPL